MGLSVGRIYEGFISSCDGTFALYEDLPTDWPVGSYCKVSQHNVVKYYKVVEGAFVETDRKEYDDTTYISSSSYLNSKSIVPENSNCSYAITLDYSYNPNGFYKKENGEWAKQEMNDNQLHNLYNAVKGLSLEENEIQSEHLPNGIVVKDVKVVPEKYYVFTENKEWVETSKREYKWYNLPVFYKLFSRPVIPYHYSYDGERYPEDNISSVEEYMKKKGIYKCEGSDLYIKKDRIYWTGRGALYDDYLSGNAYDDTILTKRGLPSNIDVDSDIILKDDEKDTYFGFDFSYITLSELTTLYDNELNKAVDEIVKRVTKDNSKEINQKLDFILEHLKDKDGSYKDAYTKFLEKKDKCNVDSEDDGSAEYEDYSTWEYPFDEFIEDTLAKPDALLREINKLSFVANLYSIYSEDDIRVIYFVA